MMSAQWIIIVNPYAKIILPSWLPFEVKSSVSPFHRWENWGQKGKITGPRLELQAFRVPSEISLHSSAPIIFGGFSPMERLSRRTLVPLSGPFSQPKTGSPSWWSHHLPEAGSFPSKRRDICLLPKGVTSGERVHQVGKRLLRVPWTARRSNQSTLKEINPEYSLEGLMMKLQLQYFGHLMQRLKVGGEGDNRGGDG